ncbi:hypothetical protein PAXINDRAFT_13929 [Paxillus involutus ATCC 200175]|uniref:Berberine/berberine-like domain-containing protein n=1 Tax=Paxillus involutus ATCC 200175 TaxID=664439 RepID=A0A0C9SVH2_PAXIN|nr:hypothetical protein PAXINDRAFT_13929 [Paxillus involutus ATCC 200175]
MYHGPRPLHYVMPAGSIPKAKQTGANPPLYEAAWHVMFGVALKTEIPPNINTDLIAAIRDAVIPLNDMDIIGSYQAEGGAYEQNWKESFFSSKYDALLAIKQKYDPGSFFNSYKGVDWDEGRAAYQCYAKNTPPS